MQYKIKNLTYYIYQGYGGDSNISCRAREPDNVLEAPAPQAAPAKNMRILTMVKFGKKNSALNINQVK